MRVSGMSAVLATPGLRDGDIPRARHVQFDADQLAPVVVEGPTNAFQPHPGVQQVVGQGPSTGQVGFVFVYSFHHREQEHTSCSVDCCHVTFGLYPVTVFASRVKRIETRLRTPDVAPELRAVEEDKLTHSSQRPIVTVVIAGNSSRINRRNILQHRSFKGTYAEAGQKCFPESPGRRWAYHWPVERELTPGSTRSGVRSLSR